MQSITECTLQSGFDVVSKSFKSKKREEGRKKFLQGWWHNFFDWVLFLCALGNGSIFLAVSKVFLHAHSVINYKHVSNPAIVTSPHTKCR